MVGVIIITVGNLDLAFALHGSLLIVIKRLPYEVLGKIRRSGQSQ